MGLQRLAKIAFEKRAALAEAAATAAVASGDGVEGTVEVTESELQQGLAVADGVGGPAAETRISPKALQAALAVITEPQVPCDQRTPTACHPEQQVSSVD